jgi:DNA-binding transcriptional ArsR family regulator
MDNLSAIQALGALAQSTRLDVFRFLAGREPKGASAGEIARAMTVPHNTMSSHLAILARAGLVSGHRRSRSIVYRASVARLRDVTLFLIADCCGGRPEQCAPLAADVSAVAKIGAREEIA